MLKSNLTASFRCLVSWPMTEHYQPATVFRGAESSCISCEEEWQGDSVRKGGGWGWRGDTLARTKGETRSPESDNGKMPKCRQLEKKQYQQIPETGIDRVWLLLNIDNSVENVRYLLLKLILLKICSRGIITTIFVCICQLFSLTNKSLLFFGNNLLTYIKMY